MNKTYMPNAKEIERDWYVIDASDIALGRLSTQVARILRGKHKAIYTPNMDCGDHVIVINAEKIHLTGNKAADKIYYRHSGFPGGIKEMSAGNMRAQKPERLIELSVKGMLPKGPLGRQMFKKLHVYAGPEHKHVAQQAKLLDIKELI